MMCVSVYLTLSVNLYVSQLSAAIKASKRDATETAKADKEEEELVKLYRDHGFRVYRVDKDGNCLFWCLYIYLTRRMPNVNLGRAVVSGHLQDLRDKMCQHINTATITEDHTAYITRMRRSGEFATEVEITALAVSQGIAIHVYTSADVGNVLVYNKNLEPSGILHVLLCKATQHFWLLDPPSVCVLTVLTKASIAPSSSPLHPSPLLSSHLLPSPLFCSPLFSSPLLTFCCC
jgi:hypothetical protein